MPAYTMVDADSHVEEPTEAWEALGPEFQARKPFIIKTENRPLLKSMNAFWYVDGNVFPRPAGQGVTIYGTPVDMQKAVNKPFALESQTLLSPEARVRDLQAAGFGIQVNYPTVFLEQLTEDPALETALIRSYNTYVGKQSAQCSDQLKWVAVLPMRDVEAAVAEIRRARELGAVAMATTCGTVGERLLNHPSFDPIWAEAERLGMPVSIHCGWSHPGIKRSFDTTYGALVLGFTLPVFMAFFAFLGGGILDRFPRLRLAFLEAGCEWVPYLVQRMDHYFGSEQQKGFSLPQRRASEYLRECEIYFTTEAEERNLPYVMEFVGEERIMIAGDMPHGEAREDSVEEIQEREDLTEEQKRKILSENAIRFYSLAAGAA